MDIKEKRGIDFWGECKFLLAHAGFLQVIVSGQRFVPRKFCATQSDAKNDAADYVLFQLGAYPGVADPTGAS